MSKQINACVDSMVPRMYAVPDPEVSNPASWLSRREVRADNKSRMVQPSAPRTVRLRRISDDRDGLSSSEVKIESRVFL